MQKDLKQSQSLPRIAPHLEYEKGIILYNSFILSSFNYWSLIWLIWTFCGKTSNDEINRLHKCALTAQLDEYRSTFGEILRKKDEYTLHIRHLQN